MSMMNLNNKIDFKNRDKIVFGNEVDWDNVPGGCKRFDSLTADTIQELIDKGLMSRTEAHNYCPEVGDILNFVYLCAYEDKFRFSGYVISPNRTDTRVSIDGVSYDGPYNYEDLIDFIRTFRFADDFNVSFDEDEQMYMSVWYD